MTTREPSNLLNHRVSRARKLLSLPHGSRNRLAPGSFDLAKGEAEQTVNLDLTVINDLANTGSRHTVLLAQRLVRHDNEGTVKPAQSQSQPGQETPVTPPWQSESACARLVRSRQGGG